MAYDSGPFREWLKTRETELIVPSHPRRKYKIQDGRPLRRYRKRWKIERTIAWLGNYRRLVIRWDRSIQIYTAFVQIVCALIVCNSL